MAVHQPSGVLPGALHLDTSAEEVLEITPGRPERDRPLPVEAPLVLDSPLLEEPGAVSLQAVHAVENRLPRPSRQAAVREPRADVPRKVHLEECVGDLFNMAFAPKGKAMFLMPPIQGTDSLIDYLADQ